ncbi:MAG: hypothetical protein LBI39_04345 [Puniceicoccales bacterium]|jgi:hypothetical protein|nr:hypothetical protein [Puniceicoccales bacterium]
MANAYSVAGGTGSTDAIYGGNALDRYGNNRHIVCVVVGRERKRVFAAIPIHSGESNDGVRWMFVHYAALRLSGPLMPLNGRGGKLDPAFFCREGGLHHYIHVWSLAGVLFFTFPLFADQQFPFLSLAASALAHPEVVAAKLLPSGVPQPRTSRGAKANPTSGDAMERKSFRGKVSRVYGKRWEQHGDRDSRDGGRR